MAAAEPEDPRARAHGASLAAAPKRWDHTLMTGNGELGAIPMLRLANETITLSNDQLMLRSQKPNLPDVSHVLPKVRQLIAEKKKPLTPGPPTHGHAESNFLSVYRWAVPRLHGRALAHMGMKQWDAALADIDAAVEGHRKGFHYAKAGPCDTMAKMRLVRAAILDRLGRKEEAKKERKNAAAPTSPHRTSPYGLFHDKLKKFRLAQK